MFFGIYAVVSVLVISSCAGVELLIPFCVGARPEIQILELVASWAAPLLGCCPRAGEGFGVFSGEIVTH